MTITMTAPTLLVQCHEQKLVSGNGISITNFTIFPNTIYDRGDCDHIISIDDSSIIETISSICNEYNFIPDTAIKQLSKSTYFYPTGTIGAIVTARNKNGNPTYFTNKRWQHRR